MRKRIFDYSFEEYLKCVKRCYSLEVQEQLPRIKDFPIYFKDLFVNKRFEKILQFSENQSNPFVASICNRIIGVYNIQNSRRNGSNLDIKETWEKISKSILQVPLNATISSVGSQGFLSIPLFKFDDIIENFEFIRFHIWSPNLEEYIDSSKKDLFSIHSHSFNAQSWIITGELINQDYKINIHSKDPNRALFKIQYNKTLNEVNQHQSAAINTELHVRVEEIRKTIFNYGDTYKIKKGEFHKSTQKNSSKISATFFSFHLRDENLVQSHVTGPIDVKKSAINRKMYIKPIEFINSINNSIKGK